MPFGSHGTSFEYEAVPKDAENWTVALPYFELERSSKPFSELAENDRNMGVEISKTARYLSSRPNAEAKRRAEEGDVEAGIDYGLRLMVGYNCPKKPTAARQYFDRILAVATNDPRIRAKAHICVALIILDVQAWQSGKITPTESLTFIAGFHYNEAAKLGYGKCPALLYFAVALTPQRHELKSMQLWTAMWTISDERNEEMDKERRTAAEKLAKRPNRYVCAAEGCGIAANTRKVLKRCAGKCSDEYKPSYCSRECQRQDWKRHKLFCAPKQPPPPTPLPAQPPGKSTLGAYSISIPHPGGQGTMEVSSSTVGLDVLKAIQKLSLEQK